MYEGWPKKIPVSYSKDDWRLDPKGYFIIGLDRTRKKIVVGYFSASGEKIALIEGDNPKEIFYTIFKNGFTSLLEHAAYLGLELEKAYLALKFGLYYVQDEGDFDFDIHKKYDASLEQANNKTSDAKYRIVLNREACICAGNCDKIAPNQFGIDSEGRAVLINSALNRKTGLYELFLDDDGEFKKCVEAGDKCPAQAIAALKNI